MSKNKKHDPITPKELLKAIGELLLFALIFLALGVIFSILILWNIPQTWGELLDIVLDSLTRSSEFVIYAIIGVFYLIFVVIKNIVKKIFKR